MPKMITKNKQIKSASDLKGQKVERSFYLEKKAVDVEQRTVELAFASEVEGERWYGVEILDCKEQSIRLDRLKSGAPLLLGHDSEKQIGVVETVSIDSDNICRAVVRLGRGALASEVLQDIEDGIRRNVSVGYMIHEAVLEREVEGVGYYRITDWEPFEISMVSMPFDYQGSGVGRDANENNNPVPVKENRKMEKCEFCGKDLAEGTLCGCTEAVAARSAKPDNKINLDDVRKQASKEARDAEIKRCKELREVGEQYKNFNGIDLADKFIKDENGTVEGLREALLKEVDKRQNIDPIERTAHGEGARVATGRYDRRSAGFQSFLSSAGNNHERAERDAYESGQWARAVVFGDERAAAWCRDNNIQLRVMTEGDNTTGGYLVPEAMENSIIDLRAEYGVARRVAEIVQMGSSVVPMPVRKSGTTAYFPGEEDEITASDMGWGQEQLVAKKVAALTRLSNDLVQDSVIDIAAKVADEHAYAFAVKEDSCLIYGDGTSTYGGIVGLKAKLEVSGMAGIYTAASNSDTPQEIILKELNGVMSVLPSYARKGAVWVSSPSFDELIFGRLMAAAGGNTTATLAGEIMPAFLGKPRLTCEPCYSDSTADLTGKAMAFYGNFKQGVLMGERRGIMVKVLSERYAEYDQIGVIGTERIDINCHGVGDTSNAGPIVALIGG